MSRSRKSSTCSNPSRPRRIAPCWSFCLTVCSSIVFFARSSSSSRSADARSAELSKATFVASILNDLMSSSSSGLALGSDRSRRVNCVLPSALCSPSLLVWTHLYRPPATALGPVPSLKASNKLSSTFLAYRLTASSSILSPKIPRTSSASLSRTKILALGRTILDLRDVVAGRVGLTSIDGFLESSRDDRCRLIGLRWRSSCSASEPVSEEVDEPSSPASEAVEDGPALPCDARVCY